MSQWKRIKGAWVHTGWPVGFASAPPPPPPPPPSVGIGETVTGWRELLGLDKRGS